MLNVNTLTPLDDKIVIFGMSSVGKTEFAKSLPSHQYCCFDRLFHWHLIETFGLSIKENFRKVVEECQSPRFVLDGWHLADKDGYLLPKDARVYVVYADYCRIVNQYRAHVYDTEDYRPMFVKWYSIDYPRLNARYFLNTGEFQETTKGAFISWLARSLQTAPSSEIQDN